MRRSPRYSRCPGIRMQDVDCWWCKCSTVRSDLSSLSRWQQQIKFTCMYCIVHSTDWMFLYHLRQPFASPPIPSKVSAVMWINTAGSHPEKFQELCPYPVRPLLLHFPSLNFPPLTASFPTFPLSSFLCLPLPSLLFIRFQLGLAYWRKLLKLHMKVFGAVWI